MYPGQPSQTGVSTPAQPLWPAPGQDPEQPPTALSAVIPATPAAFGTPVAAVRQPALPDAGTATGGPDGAALTGEVDGHLDYVSQLAKQLGVNDPVESYLTPVVGAWSQLHDEATRWRTAAAAATTVSQQLTAPLGGLDAAWQGQDADSFLDYMQKVGLAGTDLSDAMTAMATALDKTADGLRQIVQQMVDMLTDTAEQSSDAMSVPVAGESRARQHLTDADEPTSKLYESVRDVLEAFVKLCDGVHGGQLFSAITVPHPVPAQNWAPPTPPTPKPASTTAATTTAATTTAATTKTPTTTAAATHAAVPAAHATPAPAAAAHAGSGGGGSAAATALHDLGGSGGGGGSLAASAGDAAGGGVAESQSGPPPESGAAAEPASGTEGQALPAAGGAAGDASGAAAAPGGSSMGSMGGMGGMRGGGQGGNQEHKTKIRVSGDLRDIFGKPDRTAPPTIGAE